MLDFSSQVKSLEEINEPRNNFDGSELLYSRVILAKMRPLIGDAVIRHSAAIRPFSNPVTALSKKVSV
jgi:hypothetical protein